MEPLNNFSEPDNMNNGRDKSTTAKRKTQPLNIPNATILSNLNAELQLAVAHNHSSSSLGSSSQCNGAVQSVNGSGAEEKMQLATPPIAKPRRKTPVSRPRNDLSFKGPISTQMPLAIHAKTATTSPANAAFNPTGHMVTASSKMHPVVAHENVQRSKSEADLLCPLPAQRSRTCSIAQRQSELTMSTESYPYVVRSQEMQGSSFSLPNLNPFLPLYPRSESCESLYAKPMSPQTTEPQMTEPQPYLEFKPVYSYAYGKLPLKYQTTAVPRAKTLPSPQHSVGMPWRDVTRARNPTVNILKHRQRLQSNDDYEEVDSDNMSDDLNRKPRGIVIHPQAAGVENPLASPEYAEIDSSLELPVEDHVHFHNSLPGRGMMSNGVATEKQEVTMEFNSQEDSPRLEKVEGMEDRTHVHPDRQTAAASKQPSRHMNKQKSNSGRITQKNEDNKFPARGSSDQKKDKESTRNRSKKAHDHPNATSNSPCVSYPEQHYNEPAKRAPNHTSTSSDDLYDHLNQLEMQ